MRNVSIRGAWAALILLLLALSAPAATITCTQCGMISDLDSKFTSRIIEGEKNLYFCDIGDLFTYLNRKKPANVSVEVRDYPTGSWLDARKAFYVQAAKKFSSPMGWGIAAFQDGKEAAHWGPVTDFAGIMKAVQ